MSQNTLETQVLQDALFLNSSLTLFLHAPSSLTHSLLLSECLGKQSLKHKNANAWNFKDVKHLFTPAKQPLKLYISH